MEKDIKEIRKNVEELKQKTEQNTKDIAELKQMTKENTEAIKSIQRTLVIIEDAVVNKIPALFDGYAMHQEKQVQLENRINKLEDVSQMLSLKVIALEDNSRNKKVKLSS